MPHTPPPATMWRAAGPPQAQVLLGAYLGRKVERWRRDRGEGISTGRPSPLAYTGGHPGWRRGHGEPCCTHTCTSMLREVSRGETFSPGVGGPELTPLLKATPHILLIPQSALQPEQVEESPGEPANQFPGPSAQILIQVGQREDEFAVLTGSQVRPRPRPRSEECQVPPSQSSRAQSSPRAITAGRVESQRQPSQEKFQMANLTHWPSIISPLGQFFCTSLYLG